MFTAHPQEEITRALERVCARMPAHARQECDEFVTKYFERVLDLFLKGVAPEAICIAIGICDVPLQARAAPALEPLPRRSMLLQLNSLFSVAPLTLMHCNNIGNSTN